MNNNDDFFIFLQTLGYKNIRAIGANKYVCINPYLFTHAIIKGRIGDKIGFSDRWCYSTYASAKQALEKWDGKGEPEGWHRHPATGRRKDEDGNEYILP